MNSFFTPTKAALYASVLSATIAIVSPAHAQSIESVYPTAPGNIVTQKSDKSSVELGIKFQSKVDGQILGVRFYRSGRVTTNFSGSLFTAQGENLASAKVAKNSYGSGFVKVMFASPVSIKAGTTYIASYHAPAGEYSFLANGSRNAVSKGNLTLLASSASGGNGVYNYSKAVSFPKNTHKDSNYLVDVIFKAGTTTAPKPTPTATPKPVESAPPAPVEQAPAPAPAPVPSADGYGTYKKLFAVDSPWNIRPINPVLSSVGIPTDLYSPSIAQGAYSTGIFEARPTDGPMQVYGLGNQSGVWDPDAEVYLPTVTIPHWPAGVASAEGTDGHADIVDEANNIIHSFWQLRYENGKWKAAQWAWTKLNGRGWADGGHWFQGARAAAVPTSGGVIRKHEPDDGDSIYRHALAMSLPASALAKTFVFPATSVDGDGPWVHYGQIPEGALVMLPPSFDVNSLHFEAYKKIARTLQTFGARVVDRNGNTPFVIYIENGTTAKIGPDGWDNVAAGDLDRMRAAIRMVSSQSGYQDNLGRPVTLDPNGKGLQLFSLRGPWQLQSGSQLGVFDSLSQSVRFGATGATPIQQTNANGTGSKVAWAAFVGGRTYKIDVKATNGAKCRIDVRGGAFELLYSSGDLSDGQSKTFVFPNGGWITPMVTSGTNVSSSSVSCGLVQQ